MRRIVVLVFAKRLRSSYREHILLGSWVIKARNEGRS
jgi:hypothetical protein